MNKNLADITLGDLFNLIAPVIGGGKPKKSRDEELQEMTKHITNELKSYIDLKFDSLHQKNKTKFKNYKIHSEKKPKEKFNKSVKKVNSNIKPITINENKENLDSKVIIKNVEKSDFINKYPSTLDHLKEEAKMLNIKFNDKSTYEKLESKILLFLRDNFNAVENMDKHALMRFITRHQVPRTTMNLKDVDCLRNCVKAYLSDQNIRSKDKSILLKNEAAMGGNSHKYYFKLNRESKGDYNEDVELMFSENIKDTLQQVFKSGGPFSARLGFTCDIIWLGRDEMDQINKTLNTEYKVNFSKDISRQMQYMINDVKLAISKAELEGSGWIYINLDNVMISVRKYNPSTGSNYIPLPEHITHTKGYVNVKNNNGFCFKYAVISCLYPANQHVYRAKQYEKFFETVNWSGLTFPLEMKKSCFKKFEQNNPDLPPLNVFYLENHDSKFPYTFYTSCKGNCNDEKAINILYFQDKECTKGHYCWLKNKSRAFAKLTKFNGQTFICVKCLSSHTSQESLKHHDQFCNLESPMNLLMPQEKCKKDCPENCDHKYVRFNRTETKQDLPFYIICDTESISKPLKYCLQCKKNIDNDINHPSNHSILQEEHVPISYGMYIYVSEKYRDIYKGLHGQYFTYSGENLGKHLLETLIEKTKHIYKTMVKTNVKIPDNIYKEWKDKFIEGETICHICNKPITFEISQHLDHDHLSGKVRGWTHNVCNFRYTVLKHNIPVLFHNLKGYDSKAFCKVLPEIKNIKYHLIGENSEKFKYISISAYEPKNGKSYLASKFNFIDTFAHMSTSLNTLVENIKSGETDVNNLRALFPAVSNEFKNDNQFKLILRKGCFPYNWFDNIEKFEHREILNRQDFYDKLKEAEISEEDYEFYKTIVKAFEIKTFKDYHDLYLKLDVLLLADVAAKYKQTCMSIYDLDPMWYITAPGLSWQAMLKTTGAEIELIQDSTMYQFIHHAIRGGVSFIAKKYAKANNPELKSYDPNEKTSFINYVDMNSLYGYAMMNSLPVGGFQWKYTKKILASSPNIGRIYCVDLHIPENLHDHLNDFPPAPENIKVPNSNQSKLVSHLGNREKYVVLDELLEYYVKLGLKVTKIHQCLEFNKKPFLKDYIILNTKLRQKATNEFDKNFFKLMINAVYGKSLQNLTKYGDYEIVNSSRYNKLLRKPHLLKNEICLKRCQECQLLGPATFGKCSQDSECVMCVEKVRSKVYLTMPIIVGFAVLEISKLKMFEAWYKFKNYYGDRISLCMTDTDSFIYHIQTKDNVKHLKKFEEMMDFSNLPKDHKLYSESRKRVAGYLKIECADKPITSFAGLRSKCYSIKMGSDSKQTAKGVGAKNHLKHDMYESVLLNGEDISVPESNLRSFKQTMYRVTQVKKALSSSDDKRVWIGESKKPFTQDWGETLALGHVRLSTEKTN